MLESHFEERRAAEKKLGQLLQFIERVSDGFVALDRDWCYTYVNEQAASMFGRKPADLIGRHIWTEFPEGVGQPFQLAYEKAMTEQVFIQMEDYYAPWDRWFENRIYPGPNGISIFFHEITERKKAEQVARETANLLRNQNMVMELIAQGAPLQETLDLLLRALESQSPGMLCSILLLDADGMHVRHCAAPSLPATYTAAIDGQPIGPAAGSCGTAAFRRAPVLVEDIATDPLWRDYREFALAHGLRACWSTPIFDAQRKVLGTFALYFREPAIPREEHRQLIEAATHTAAIAIVKDRENDALRAGAERLRLAVTSGNVGIWEWDIARDTLVWNDLMKAMFGWPADLQLTPEMFYSVVHADDRPVIAAEVERALTEHTDYDGEYRIVLPDGSQHWIAARGRGEYDAAGKPVRMIGAARDVTERKRALEILEQSVTARTTELRVKNEELEHEISERARVEELLRGRNDELKAFAYTVSHDLKAPLRGIAGYARELDRRHKDLLSERALFCLQQILTATGNLDQLIEDLLHYSRLDAETPTPTEVDLVQLVQDIFQDRKPIVLERLIALDLNLSVSVVRTWHRGLIQVLSNLIDNAIKYSRHANPPSILITSRELADSTEIVVADNGIGFDMRYHDRIFQLFNRLVRQEEFEGTGAGLAIAKKVIEKLGGRIYAESSPGNGARFFIELPGNSGAESAT
jgi:PAS domain S-box-containing protein